MLITIETSKNFDKKFRKLAKKLQLQAKSRILIFMEQPFNPQLNNHSLHGDKKFARSINISGDVRILYVEVDDTTVRFLDIDTHHNLYGS